MVNNTILRQVITYNNTPISFVDEGKGRVIVLLHGYLESLESWNDFSKELINDFRVIRIDLPGHGKSGNTGEVNSMELMAECVNDVLMHLKINKSFIVGHSMGGYATLAFAEKYAEKLAGFCLFHSNPFADSDEKKNIRNREIAFVKKGKKDFIQNISIPNAFASENLLRLGKELTFALNIAQSTPDEGIIASLEGMKSRTDKTDFLRNTKLPFLLILGKKDNYIPYEFAKQNIPIPINGKLEVLENSGHNGFIEEKEKAVKIIKEFCKEVF